jgi:hypothetical protein
LPDGGSGCAVHHRERVGNGQPKPAKENELMESSPRAAGWRALGLLILLVALLGVAALAPQLASADTPGTIQGTVTNSAAQGLAGAGVRAVNVATGNDYGATTASDGTYSIAGLPAGSYQVLFTPAAGTDYVYQYYPNKSNAAAAQPVAVTAGQSTTNINASLAVGATVSGQVTDAATHAAVSGVTVYVDDLGGESPRNVYPDYATTDGSGNWTVSGLPSGTYQVSFQPSYSTNYAFQYYNNVVGNDPPTAVTLTAGTTTQNIDAALTMGGEITGTVTNGMTGKPVQGADVVAIDAFGSQYDSTQTDNNGNYTLVGLSSSASYRVEFFAPQGSSLAGGLYPSGSTLAQATPISVTAGQTTPNIDETLGQGGSISGAVTDAATGYPIGGAQVMLTDAAGNPVYPSESASTEPDGTYDFTNLAPGSYKVEFSSEGGLGFQFYNDVSTLSAAGSVTVGAGQAVTGIDAALTQGGILKGHVSDAVTGQGLPDTFVDVIDGRGDFLASTRTDLNGDYEVTGIAPGSYYVQFFYFGGPPLFPYLFYGGSSTLAGATPVTISAGGTTTGIDIALSPQTAPPANGSTPPLPTNIPPVVAPVSGQAAAVTPGPPRLFGGSVSGLGKGMPVVKFRLASGANGAHKLHSFKVKLPAGLTFVASHLGKGVKVTGGGKVTEKIAGGQLVVTLRSPATVVTVSISSPALKVTGQLKAKAARRRAGELRVIVTVMPVNAAGHTLSFTVKNPA